jgi:peptide/nickel transport system permease protein
MFARILFGGRVTLGIAFVSTFLSTVVGGTIGLISGYFGGRADYLFSRVLDIIASIPVFLLVITLETALGWGRGNFMYAMAIAAVPQFAQLIRALAMRVMGSEYIEAASALGIGHFEIMVRHVLRNCAPPMIVRFTSGLTEALLFCAVMGYLGVGIRPPTPEWGMLASIGQSDLMHYPHMMLIPCAAITITAISANLFSDGLRDALDSREGG